MATTMAVLPLRSSTGALARAALSSPAMAFFLRPSGPRALWKDLTSFWRGRPRGQWVAAVLAVSATSAIVLGFYLDSRSIPDRREQVIFIDSWPATRTDAEIVAKQKADQAERDAAREAHRRRLEEIDQSLNRLGI